MSSIESNKDRAPEVQHGFDVQTHWTHLADHARQLSNAAIHPDSIGHPQAATRKFQQFKGILIKEKEQGEEEEEEDKGGEVSEGGHGKHLHYRERTEPKSATTEAPSIAYQPTKPTSKTSTRSQAHPHVSSTAATASFIRENKRPKVRHRNQQRTNEVERHLQKPTSTIDLRAGIPVAIPPENCLLQRSGTLLERRLGISSFPKYWEAPPAYTPFPKPAEQTPHVLETLSEHIPSAQPARILAQQSFPTPQSTRVKHEDHYNWGRLRARIIHDVGNIEIPYSDIMAIPIPTLRQVVWGSLLYYCPLSQLFALYWIVYLCTTDKHTRARERNHMLGQVVFLLGACFFFTYTPGLWVRAFGRWVTKYLLARRISKLGDVMRPEM